MQIKSSTYLNEAKAIWIRDIKGELRNKYAINTILLFAFTTLIAISFSLGAYRIPENQKPFLYSVLLWITLIFSALSGLSRTFIKEEEAHTSDVLKLSARPEAILIGKLLFNLTLLILLITTIVPTFIIIMNYPVNNYLYFIVIILSGSAGLGVGTTLIAAMIAKANVRSSLFSVLSLPLLFPLMITAIKGCEKAALNIGIAGWHEVKIILAYFIIMLTISLFLFPVIWHE